MKLDDVQRIAHLSRLELNQAEAEAVLPQLQAIFSLVEEMQAVDTTVLSLWLTQSSFYVIWHSLCVPTR